ncbi:protein MICRORCHIDIA 4-like [Papaver somniferum]|uniref:protein MICRORCHIDIA 4-like n=1 Tax=Papaver somniferum TaxID=3469 RepID=UPI000E700212|nr:protein MICRORCHIDIA 4-like [Papaver somniferum]
MENPSVLNGESADSTSSSSSSSWLTYKRARRANGEEEEITSDNKKTKFVLPPDFLEPLNKFEKEEKILAHLPLSSWNPGDSSTTQLFCVPYCRQFWKAGDYEDSSSGREGDTTLIDGMDHVRVHPRFLHSNATSHKWVLGAVAELLDNSLDEAINGGTYCHIDMLLNKKDGSRMLLVEDNGGGMSPGTMRHCMSLGYSAKSKLANTIGQYGNGFKTSTMRVGADVIVFSRCPGKDGGRATQSIGLLSYTFLTCTGKEDIVVPILDYEKNGEDWSNIVQASSSSVDWNKNVETIAQWSPYASEAELLEQFNFIKDQGTRIIIYNLWEDEEGDLELDFESDIHDIQIRGANRDEMKIQMAKDYPKSEQFLTYTHSLRSYSSILYLKPPPGFRIILRGQDVVHYNIVSNMYKLENIRYKPAGLDSAKVNAKRVIGKMGFHKDAKAHLDIQGFNAYHRNRLIKPFWRVWNTPSSGGRGVIGVVEANFIKPAHDKQDFEKTIMLSRLETKLIDVLKKYWNKHKSAIGYFDPKHMNTPSTSRSGKARRYLPKTNYLANAEVTIPVVNAETTIPVMEKCDSLSIHSDSTRRGTLRSAQRGKGKQGNGCKNHEGTGMSVENGKESGVIVNVKEKPADQNLASERNEQVADSGTTSGNNLITENLEWRNRKKRTSEILSSDSKSKPDRAKEPEDEAPQADAALLHDLQVENRELKDRIKEVEEKHLHDLKIKQTNEAPLADAALLQDLQVENRELKDRIKELEEKHLLDLKLQKEKPEEKHLHDLELQAQKLEEKHLHDLELQREKCRALEAQLKEANDNFEVLDNEQDTLIDLFSEERTRRDAVEENLTNKLKAASVTIQELQDKVCDLERKNLIS